MADNLTPKEEFLLNPVTEHNITDAAIASFETNFKHPVKVTVPITPVQDLHGYDHPWPAGGGKNLFDGVYPEIATTLNYRPINVGDGTFTMSSDISLTPNENVANIFFLPGNVSSGASTGTNGVYANRSITTTAVDGYVTIAYRSHDTLNPENYNTQIERGSTATSYEPYENICPIEGWTECEVTRAQENLLPIKVFNETKYGIQSTYLGNGWHSLQTVSTNANQNYEPHWVSEPISFPFDVYIKAFVKNKASKSIAYYLKLNGSNIYPSLTSGYRVAAGTVISQLRPRFNTYQDSNGYNNTQYAIGIFPAEQVPNDYIMPQLNSLPISWKHAEGTYNFDPIQAGEGDPSPTNVRPITPGLTITRDDNTELTVWGGSITFNGDGTSRVVSDTAQYTVTGAASEYWNLYNNNKARFFSFDGAVGQMRTCSSTECICNMFVSGSGFNPVIGAASITRSGSATYVTFRDIEFFGSTESEMRAKAVELYENGTPIVVTGKLIEPVTYNLSIAETQRAITALGDKVTTMVYGGTFTVNEDGSVDVISAYKKEILKDATLATAAYINENFTRGRITNLINYKGRTGQGLSNYLIYKGTFVMNDEGFGFDSPSILYITLNNLHTGIVYGEDNLSSAQAKFTAYLKKHPLITVLEMDAPITYHLPNVGQLKAFIGENNVWSDAGNVNVRYLTQNSETGVEYRGDRALELRRRAMMADAPTIHTTVGSEETGGLASFKSYVKSNVKKIEVPFYPKQDLHGYDHPWPAGGGKNLFNKDGAFIDDVVIKSEMAYKLASGTGSAISTVTPGTTVLLNETIDGVTKLKPWIYLGLDESGNARLLREKADDEIKSMSVDGAIGSCDYVDSNIDLYLTNETTGFLSRFDTATLNALAATSIKYVDYVSSGTNTGTITTISRKCFLPSYSEMGYGDDPVGNEGQSYLAALKIYYENNKNTTVQICRTEERISAITWLRSEYDDATSRTRYRIIYYNGQASLSPANSLLSVRPMISLNPNTLVDTVIFGKDTFSTNVTLYTDPIAVPQSTTYTLSGRCYADQVMRVDEYDADDNFLRSTVSASMNHPSITFTTTENTAYVLVNPDWAIQFVQLEAGSVATSYAPYSNICPIEGYSDGISCFESKKANIYGARWDRLQHRLTRYGAAKDFDTDVTNFRINGEASSSYNNPFDDLYPWSERKLCNINLTQYMALQNGSSITDCVTHWEGETGFSYDDPDGVWVYTPKFWGRSYDDANGHRCFEVADRPVHDFIEYEEQITARWRGVVEERTINGESKQVLLPTLGNPGRYIPINNLHTYAKNYGGSITSIYSLDASYLLMIVEFASMNPRLDVGGGVNNFSRQNAADKIAENATDSTVIKLPNSYAVGMIPDALIDIGTAYNGNQIGSRWIVSAELNESTNLWTVTLNEPVTVTTANFWSVSGMANRPDAAIGSKSGYLGENNRSHAYYRGEELWGNMIMYVIGVYKSTRNEVWLCPKNLDPDNYSELNTTDHVNTGIQLLTVSGFSREFGYPEKSHGLSAPALSVLAGGNSTDPIGSQSFTSVRNPRILIVGADASFSNSVGFCWDWRYASSFSNRLFAASPRLKNPPKGA